MKVIILAGLIGFFIGFFIGALSLGITLIGQNNGKKSKERLKVSLLRITILNLKYLKRNPKVSFLFLKQMNWHVSWIRNINQTRLSSLEMKH